jgi:hypothetical protein
MGYDDRERRQLAAQASILLRPFTEDLFRRAGITTGMHAVVAWAMCLCLWRVSCPHGSVTSIDVDPAVLQTLRDRAAAEGIRTIRSVPANIHSFDPAISSMP